MDFYVFRRKAAGDYDESGHPLELKSALDKS